MRTNEQFHNEILFYQRYAKHHEEFPRCLLAEEKPPSDSVIVLENVIVQRGYDISKWKHDVPIEYTMAAFREIARFHAKAYVAKERRGEEFFDFVNGLQEVRYYSESILKVVYDGTANRSVKYLRGRGYDPRFCDKLEDKLRNTYDDLVMKYVKPEEPLATLCHGDFTMNNTLFKNENGEIKCMFIDFALTRYGSPVLDLSTFLCLHCARQVDKSMLDKVLKAYHDSLTRCLEESGVDSEKYSFEALREDYKRKGLFGFFVATFFLPTVMGLGDCSPEKFIKIDIQNWGSALCEQGGDECSEIMANMLLRLKEFGCLDDLLDD
uniref:Juvenile hormone-inducible protein n=1 Tax=Apis cerana TaxID=7461 RepID=V9IEF0_APICE